MEAGREIRPFDERHEAVGEVPHTMKEGRLSRAERILMARENCNLSLGGAKPIQTNKMDEEERNLIEGSYNKGDGTIHLSKVQGFVLRSVVAILLFLCVMLMDKYQIGNETVIRSNMEKVLTSSQQAHQVEDAMRKIWEENVDVVSLKSTP